MVVDWWYRSESVLGPGRAGTALGLRHQSPRSSTAVHAVHPRHTYSFSEFCLVGWALELGLPGSRRPEYFLTQ